jgi:hypothetical protein
MVYKALTKEPAFTIAITAAGMHQVVISSAAAQVITMVPSLVFYMPLFCIMRASTGKAVILMEMPVNKAKDAKLIPGGAK